MLGCGLHDTRVHSPQSDSILSTEMGCFPHTPPELVHRDVHSRLALLSDDVGYLLNLVVDLTRSLMTLRTLSWACMTVVWSLPPNSEPILGSERLVSSRARYMAICRGKTIFWDRLLPTSSAWVTL